MHGRVRVLLFESILVVLLAHAGQARGQNDIVSVEPGQAEAGSTVEITVTGEPYVYFVAPVALSFSPAGDMIAHGQVAVDTVLPYVLSTTIQIDAATPPGPQDLTVTSAGVDFTGEAVFEVLPAPVDPRIVSVTPGEAGPGEMVQVTVTGADTHFAAGSELVFSPPGVVVEETDAASATELEATLTVEQTASPGLRSVTVTTGDEVASGEDLFLVVAAEVFLSPSSGTQGDTLSSLEITGGPGTFTGGSRADLGRGINVGATDNPDPYTLRLRDVWIAPNAPVGPRDLVLTDPDLTVPDAFLVVQGPDTLLLSVTPDHGDRGHPGLALRLEGQNTHFTDSDLSVLLAGADLEQVARDAVDDTHLDVVVALPDDLPEGAVDLTVALGRNAGCSQCERVTLASGFEVTRPGTIDQVTPRILEAGTSAVFDLSASDGGFVDGTTELVLVPDDGLEVLSATVNDADHLQAEIRAAPDAPGTLRDLRAATGTEVALGPGMLDVFRPEILTVRPRTALRGTQGIHLTIEGRDIPFDSATRILFSGEGITVEQVSYDADAPDRIEAVLSVAETAAPGSRDVTVEAGDFTVTAEDAFRVIVYDDPGPGDDAGGCGCRTPAGGGWWAWLLVALAWLARRIFSDRERHTAQSSRASR